MTLVGGANTVDTNVLLVSEKLRLGSVPKFGFDTEP